MSKHKSRLCAPGRQRAAVVEPLEGRMLLSTYMVTSLADDGSAGTLRWAVQQANANPGADTINFAAGLTGTITLTAGQLEISDTSGQTTIAGPGEQSLIILSKTSRDIAVDAGAALSLSSLSTRGVDSGPLGGGAIVNSGSATLQDCAVAGDAAGNGGGIYNTGSLIASRCRFGFGGQSATEGGGIYNDGGSLTLNQCQFSGISSSGFTVVEGGGIYNQSGTADVAYCTFDELETQGTGAAIDNHGTFSLANSIVSNSLGNLGPVQNTGTMTVTESTLSPNVGPLYNAGNLTVRNTTMNSVDSGIAVVGTAGNTTVYNSIIYAITGALDQHLPTGQPPSSHDLIITSRSGGLVNGMDGNLVSVDPRLSYFNYFGGPTQTVVPLPGSPAIDAGSNSLAIDAGGPSGAPNLVDQRGLPRIDGGTVDIGAVESQPPLVNSDQGNGDLVAPGQESFLNAFLLSTQADAGNVIRFDPSVYAPGTRHSIAITLSLVVSGPEQLTIDGPGADILELQTMAAGSLALGQGATLSINHATIKGKGVQDNGGTLNITNCYVLGNHAPAGIVNLASSTLSVSDTAFYSNFGFDAGAIDNAGTATVTGCTFSGNISQSPGGAIHNEGKLILIDCTITGNSAPSGGAIDQIAGSASTVSIFDSTIWANSSDSGGAIDGPVRLVNSIVAGNTLSDGKTPADISSSATGSNNLIGTGGSGGLINGQNGNIVGVADPKLAPLGDYGGPTQAMPPLPGSPAIDAGSNALVPSGITTDQRGLSRISGGVVDIGAGEYQWTPGDANKDGKVNFQDLVALAANYRLSSGATWAQGDFDGDGKVDFKDLVLLASNYGSGGSASPAAPPADGTNTRSAALPDLPATLRARTQPTLRGRLRSARGR